MMPRVNAMAKEISKRLGIGRTFVSAIKGPRKNEIPLPRMYPNRPPITAKINTFDTKIT
jgi:hypothetical protein